MKRLISLSAVLAFGLCSVAWSQASQQNAAPPTGPDPANFTGKITPHPTTDIRMNRYTFDPGARTNWHSHEGGQVVIVEKGRMRTLERGGVGREFGPRETYVVAPNVTHWHGALPDAPLTQVALSYGVTNWMSPVSDAEYAGAARK